jgi:hypothetical protein
MEEDENLLAAPGAVLRDTSYQDLCTFFATYEEGMAWQPGLGDWVVVPPETEPLLVTAYDRKSTMATLLRNGGDRQQEVPRASCVWLPTLDQLHRLIRRQFGTTGFFSSTFKGSTYWYTGQMLGMAITNMQPLAEGKSPEEAAVKALLLRYVR